MSDERPHHNLNRDNYIEKDDPRTCYNLRWRYSLTNVDRMNYTVFQPQFPHSFVHRRRPEVAGGGRVLLFRSWLLAGACFALVSIFMTVM